MHSLRRLNQASSVADLASRRRDEQESLAADKKHLQQNEMQVQQLLSLLQLSRHGAATSTVASSGQQSQRQEAVVPAKEKLIQEALVTAHNKAQSHGVGEKKEEEYEREYSELTRRRSLLAMSLSLAQELSVHVPSSLARPPPPPPVRSIATLSQDHRFDAQPPSQHSAGGGRTKVARAIDLTPRSGSGSAKKQQQRSNSGGTRDARGTRSFSHSQ